ncbi:MAG: DUF4332 domain-containing protein [Egibacteraceae bacterium]
MKAGGSRAGRTALVEQAGLASGLLRWVDHAGLFRIRGVGGEYAELLKAAGVDQPRPWSGRSTIR